MTSHARVVSVGRNAAWIAFEGSDRLHLAGLRKTLDRTRLAPGDLVDARRLEDGHALVERVLPRSFALERRTGGGRTKTMAANVDGIAIVSALADPPPYVPMIDELLAFAELHQIAARIFFTKADVAPAARRDELLALYDNLGYPVLAIDAKHGVGIDAVANALAGHQTLLIGQSGVGKSSLFRALGGKADVGELSRIGRGKQTTTTGRLHEVEGGFLIDSPGVAEFELHDVEPRDVASGFVEFAPLVSSCRFTDCTHRAEPGCAVHAAVGASVAPSRYASYLAILERNASGSSTRRASPSSGSRAPVSMDDTSDSNDDQTNGN